jgi:Brp/Blh family beta-carotene 15,15'-monooxygenase
MALLIVGYLTLMGLVMLLWILAPIAGFLFFILLTWVHWGLSDLQTVTTYNSRDLLSNRLLRGATAFIRGGLPMLVPLIFFPDDYRLALVEIISLFTATPMNLTLPFLIQTRLTLLVLFVLITLVTLLYVWRIARRTKMQSQFTNYAIETGLLFVFFATVPPFLAVGLYFSIWHSIRYIIRLVDIQSEGYKHEDDSVSVASFYVFSRQSAPLTFIALLILGALYFLFPASQEDLISLIGLYLALIAALTLPHTVIAVWLDKEQGIWQIS